MNILYTITDDYAPQVSASIISVCENSGDAEGIRFFVLGRGIRQETTINLTAIAEAYGHELTVIPLDDREEVFDDFDTTGWNRIVLARLLIARFVPETISRILYLDGDTIVLDSLAELWGTEFDEGEILGAVTEPTVDRKRLASLGLDAAPYVNAGVLLIDLDAWREAKAETLILDYFEEHGSDLFANDQDAINGALEGRIRFLPPSYNWCNSYAFYPYRAIRKMMGDLPYYSESEFEEYAGNPAIVHFLGEERPWREGNRHRYRNRYLEYLSIGPYAGQGFEHGWQLYFAVWDAFNAIMKPFPIMRWHIITKLIPSAMSIRSKGIKKADGA